jgi:hypothetical protein
VSEQLYRIKPLVWEYRTSWGQHVAETPMGRYLAWTIDYDPLDCAWAYPGQAAPFRTTDSLEAAKAAAEAHYRQRLEQMLEKAAPSPQEKP